MLVTTTNQRVQQFGVAAKRVKITYYVFHLTNTCCTVVNTVLSSLHETPEIITIFSCISLACLYIISNLNLADASEFLLYQEKYAQLARLETIPTETFDALESSSRNLQSSIFFS